MTTIAPAAFSPPASDLASDMRRRILSLELPPGSAISRSELQAYYALSSTPVRDALIRLQEEGLVEIHPQARTRATRIDLAQAQEAHFLRSALERSIARQLAHSQPPDLVKQLKHIISLQREQIKTHDFMAFAQLDLAFHRMLFEASGHLTLFEVVRRESIHIDRLRAIHLPMGDKAQQILSDHADIVEAIASENADRAEAAIAHHLSQSITIAQQISQNRPDYFKH
jgi:GntR family transcriptional regulator, rspAB operon transcriptional repressor